MTKNVYTKLYTYQSKTTYQINNLSELLQKSAQDNKLSILPSANRAGILNTPVKNYKLNNKKYKNNLLILKDQNNNLIQGELNDKRKYK